MVNDVLTHQVAWNWRGRPESHAAGRTSAVPVEVRSNVRASLAASPAGKPGLDVGQPYLVRPAIGEGSRRMAALVIATIDQHTPDAAFAHLSERDFQLALHRRMIASNPYLVEPLGIGARGAGCAAGWSMGSGEARISAIDNIGRRGPIGWSRPNLSLWSGLSAGARQHSEIRWQAQIIRLCPGGHLACATNVIIKTLRNHKAPSRFRGEALSWVKSFKN